MGSIVLSSTFWVQRKCTFLLSSALSIVRCLKNINNTPRPLCRIVNINRTTEWKLCLSVQTRGYPLWCGSKESPRVIVDSLKVNLINELRDPTIFGDRMSWHIYDK